MCVLSDQAIIVGVNQDYSTTIIRENINDRSAPAVVYSANIDTIDTLVVDEPNNMLLAGSQNDYKGQVVQYDLSTGRMVKNYGPIGIGSVQSSARLGNLCMFGGRDSSKFVVIDSATRQAVETPLTTKEWNIVSMTVCSVQKSCSEPKVFLIISGRNPRMFKINLDIVDITGLVAKSSCVSAAQIRNANVVDTPSLLK